MGLLTYSQTLIAGTPENINTVQAMFDQIRGILNGSIDGANILDGSVASADIATGGVDVTDLATAAKELFPQLSAPGPRKINFGQGTATYPGSGSDLLKATFAHGLGVGPLIVLGALRFGAGGFYSLHFVGAESVDATNVTIALQTMNGVTVGPGSTAGFSWLAIG